ncbi:hypothetical protein J2853_008530 [Streptosporangium lutulentum]|uniref:Uncharacterized protein n=1 Tax=Streptosporangium lutulentum TaxID=1461250 RepID=A0ABT9QTG0_9ACTN|nr:hypothetical protein [Streptosporangium lutulentum]
MHGTTTRKGAIAVAEGRRPNRGAATARIRVT